MNKITNCYIHVKRLLNSRGSASMYVILTFAILMIIVSYAMLSISRMNNSVKIKDNQTMAEASAVNHFKSTINEYNNLSVIEKYTETVEHNGQTYTVEIVPTDDIKTKTLTKEFDFTSNKIDSTKDYMWDSNFIAQTAPSIKQSVYGTVSAISTVNAKNNSDNQYFIYTNSKYDDSRNPINVTLRGLINNNTKNADKVPSNYINSTNGEIRIINKVDKVRVTKNNDEFEYVKNYPNDTTFPFSNIEVGMYLVEYLDKNNNLMFWSRFFSGNEPSKSISNMFTNRNFLTDTLDRRPNNLHGSDVPVTLYKNAILLSETSKYNSSLTEQKQTLENIHVTDDVQANKTSGVSLNLVWDYMQACVREEVRGYPFTGELTPIGMKVLTDYEGSNCKVNQANIKYDLSLSQSRSSSTLDSYPFYTNWSFLDPKQVESVFDYYNRNKSELFHCINGANQYYCSSQNNLNGTSKSIYSNLTRQSIKENFLFCEMPGYKVTVMDSNERWMKFSNEKYVQLVNEINRLKEKYIADETSKAYDSAEEGQEVKITIEEVGQIPSRPVISKADQHGINSYLANIDNYPTTKTMDMPLYLNEGDDSEEGPPPPLEVTIYVDYWDLAKKASSNLNLESQFKAEIARAEKYQVPCLKGLSVTDRNYRYTVDEVPNTLFNLDILTNTPTAVKITTKHKPEVKNARTSYLLSLLDGNNTTRVYYQNDVNSDIDRDFNKTDVVNVKPNYTHLDFANLNKDFSLRTNRLRFSFSSFNRILDYIKVEYDVIESVKYEYHFYNSKGERLYFTEEVKHNSL